MVDDQEFTKVGFDVGEKSLVTQMRFSENSTHRKKQKITSNTKCVRWSHRHIILVLDLEVVVAHGHDPQQGCPKTPILQVPVRINFIAPLTFKNGSIKFSHIINTVSMLGV